MRVSKRLFKQEHGFSLLEVMIALMVFIVLMIATVNVVKNQREYDHLVENQRYMNHVKEAFMTFVKVNYFLPCPDSDGDGKENREDGPGFECTREDGQVPFLDLGVPATDAWNQPLYYAVNARADQLTVGAILGIDAPTESASYFNSGEVVGVPAPVFTFTTRPMSDDFPSPGGNGNYRVCGENTSLTTGCNAVGTANNQFLERFAIAVVVSFGENGHATWNAINTGSGLVLDDAEAENMDGDQNYWQAVGSQRDGQKFDDKLFWLLGSDIKYAIISSGGTL